MRLLFVNSAWPQSWGGGEKWTVTAATWFAQRGHQVMVVGRPTSILTQAAREQALATHEHDFRGDWDPRSVFRAFLLLQEFEPDLIVVNFNKEAWQFGLASRSQRIPVAARHGFPLLRKSMHHRWLMTYLVDHLIVNASSLKSEYASLGFNMSRTEVILNGVELRDPVNGELRRMLNIGDDVPLIVAAGRLESQKRFDLFLEVASRAAAKFPSAHFVIFGNGPLKPDIENLAREHTLSRQLHFEGFSPRFAELVCDADLFLLTSEQEGTPNVLLEAMAAGVPSIAFNVGAVPEVLTGSLSANVIAFNDVPAMSARTIEILGSPELKQSLSGEVKRCIQEEFALDRSMKHFEELFLRWAEQ